jgi:hypothetical protein
MTALLAAAAILLGAVASGGEFDEGRLDRRVSIEFKGVAFSKCLETLAEKAGVNVVAEQEVIREMGAKPVTLTLKDVPVWSLLHLFARSCGLDVSHEHGAFIFEKAAGPNEVWARLEMEVGDGELEVRVLRRDVNPELRRGLVGRLLHRRMREMEEDDDRGEEGDEGGGEEEDRPVKKPARGEDAPRKPKKGELF